MNTPDGYRDEIRKALSATDDLGSDFEFLIYLVLAPSINDALTKNWRNLKGRRSKL